jgi:hypothetical protein
MRLLMLIRDTHNEGIVLVEYDINDFFTITSHHITSHHITLNFITSHDITYRTLQHKMESFISMREWS